MSFRFGWLCKEFLLAVPLITTGCGKGPTPHASAVSLDVASGALPATIDPIKTALATTCRDAAPATDHQSNSPVANVK